MASAARGKNVKSHPAPEPEENGWCACKRFASKSLRGLLDATIFKIFTAAAKRRSRAAGRCRPPARRDDD